MQRAGQSAQGLRPPLAHPAPSAALLGVAAASERGPGLQATSRNLRHTESSVAVAQGGCTK
eukprot:4319-Heterococcus_DN1.PRE.1